MNDIEIVRKALSKKHPCDKVHEALDNIEKRLKNNIKIEVYQKDWIPGFAGFVNDGQVQKDGTAHVVLNIGDLLAIVKDKEIEASDLPYVVAECLMHEIIHVLESWADVEFSEERVEELIEKYQDYVSRLQTTTD